MHAESRAVGKERRCNQAFPHSSEAAGYRASFEYVGYPFMSAKTEITKALQQWLDHDTWYTDQVLDASRFYRAVAQIIANAGTVWTEAELKEAVYDIIGIDLKAAFEEQVDEYTNIAMNIRDYETVRPELLFPDGLIGSTRAYRT